MTGPILVRSPMDENTPKPTGNAIPSSSDSRESEKPPRASSRPRETPAEQSIGFHRFVLDKNCDFQHVCCIVYAISRCPLQIDDYTMLYCYNAAVL